MSERMDREIDEILRRFDSHPARKRRTWRGRLKSRFASIRDRGFASVQGVGLGHLMIASFFIICVAYFFRINPLVNYSIMRWIIVGGLVLFVVAFVLSMRRGGSSIPRERRWRGQRVDYGESNFADRLRSWFDRSRRGRR